MNLYRIALNNLLRRKVKMLLIMCGLVVGIAATVALVMIVQAMRLDLGDQIDAYGANIVILPRAEGMELNYGGTHVTRVSFDLAEFTADDLQLIAQIPDAASINIVSPKLVAAVKAGGRDLLLIGVDPRQEFAMKPWLSLQRQDGLEAGGKPEELAMLELPSDGILLGSAAARTIGLQPGDRFMIGETGFQITGILAASGGVEDGLVYAALPAVQALMERPGKFSMIEISAFCNACPVEEIAAQLHEVLPHGKVTPLRQAALLRAETIDGFSALSLALAGVTLFTAALMLLATMIAAVNERTREIGIFRAIGFRSFHVMQIILVEAAVIGLAGGLSGFLLGGAAARTAGPYLAGIETAIPWQFNLLPLSLLLAAVLAVLAAVYPALKAARLDPLEALRFI